VWACTKLSRQSHEIKVTILWNERVQTDRTIPNKKLDIIICDNGKGTCLLIGVAISGDRNVIKKEAEKILKYRECTREIVEFINKSDTSNNRRNWINFKIIRKLPEQRTGSV